MKRELEDLAQLLGTVEVGTADQPRRVRRIDLAVQRAREWQAERLISGDSSRGGSSSPSEQADRSEEVALGYQITRDLLVLQRALDAIKELPAIRAAVARYTVTIDASKLPSDPVPGCRSCARVGCFEPVMPAKDEVIEGVKIRGNAEANRLRLGRWCWDHRDATGEDPPKEAVKIMHDQSPRAASIWLARQGKAA